MLANTRERWGSLAKTFHWLVAILIVIEVPVGFLMTYTYGLSFRDKGAALPLHTLFSQIHHTDGFLILLLATARLAWRLHGPRPKAETSHFVLQHRLAGLTHALLYALLILLPFSGWAALSAYGVAPIWLFDRSDIMPWILPEAPLGSPFGYGLFAHIHVYAVWTGGVLLSLHVAASLWHQFVVRDDAFRRMWPLAGMVANRSFSKVACEGKPAARYESNP
jgi:cytochrome b561